MQIEVCSGSFMFLENLNPNINVSLKVLFWIKYNFGDVGCCCLCVNNEIKHKHYLLYPTRIQLELSTLSAK